MPDDARLDDTAALVKAAGADFVFLTEDCDKRDVWVHRVRVVPHEDDTLSLYCCHLPHDYKARTDIVAAILEDIGCLGTRAVVGGDMNSLAISGPITMPCLPD